MTAVAIITEASRIRSRILAFAAGRMEDPIAIEWEIQELVATADRRGWDVAGRARSLRIALNRAGQAGYRSVAEAARLAC